MDEQEKVNIKEEFFSKVLGTLNHQPQEAINILNDPKYNRILENSGWELVPRLYENLTEKNRSENLELFNCSADNLLEISKFANPEDILFEFIEQAEKQDSIYNFIIILKAIKLILLRLPQRRGIAIGWCCNAIIRYISEINIPQNGQPEGNEQLLFESDSEFQLIQDLYLEVLDFFFPFVEEIKNVKYTVPADHVETYKDTILKALLKLLGYPLVNTCLEKGKNKGAFRIIAENILNLVVCFNEDLLSFLDYVGLHAKENTVVESEYNTLSLGVLYYMILVEGVYFDKVPCIYSSFYLLKQVICLTLSLMKLDDVNAQWKGLSLAENALSRISDKAIIFEEAHRYQCKEFAEICTKIMIYSDSRRNREKAVTVFCKFIHKFDPCGRYHMLLSIQDIIKIPGFIGYLATKTKDFIAESLSTKNMQELKYFSGKCLKDLIKKFCFLEDDCETDLMQYVDQIIPSLNLIRYITIRDLDNSTGFSELLPFLAKTFFCPLKKAIEISRAHYILQKSKINSETNSVVIPTTVTVGRNELTQISSEQKFQIINEALISLDLIESILVRVIECIEDRKLKKPV